MIHKWSQIGKQSYRNTRLHHVLKNLKSLGEMINSIEHSLFWDFKIAQLVKKFPTL
jgi:hypothetical protein